MTRKEFMKTFGIAVVAVSVTGFRGNKSIPMLYGGGVHDDTAAIQALIDGMMYVHSKYYGKYISIQGPFYRME